MASRAWRVRAGGRIERKSGQCGHGLWTCCVHCYAEAVGAHTALLLGQRTNPGRRSPRHLVARGPRCLSPQWTSESLLERALQGDGPLVESQPPDVAVAIGPPPRR